MEAFGLILRMEMRFVNVAHPDAILVEPMSRLIDIKGEDALRYPFPDVAGLSGLVRSSDVVWMCNPIMG